MKTTITLSSNLNCSPFEVFDQDIDEVITLINFYIELSVESGSEGSTIGSAAHNREKRIRVNDKTATGGWW